ncbi:MAG: MarR family transcriptional regulator [Ruminococcaceae bacterium]|nr:MarR family transcriptional regulator [Oscillospiraceae bacterium]
MDAFEKNLNTLLVRVYDAMDKLEEAMLRASSSIPLSISEIHALEAVVEAGSGEVATISELSEYLDVRLPSVTNVVNKLERKGYVERMKCGNDGRVVRVSLTREGRRAERAHRYFHRTMVRSVTQELSEEEQQALLKGIGKLDAFLEKNIRKYKEIT